MKLPIRRKLREWMQELYLKMHLLRLKIDPRLPRATPTQKLVWRIDFVLELCNAAYYRYSPENIAGLVVKTLKAPGPTYAEVLQYVTDLQITLAAHQPKEVRPVPSWKKRLVQNKEEG